MVRSGRPDSTDGQPSLGELVATALKDVSSLVRYEISLAKSELKMDARRIMWAAGFAVVGLFVGCLVLVLLCFAFAYGLVAAGLPGGTWAAFLVVAGTCVLLILIAVLIAWSRIRKVTGMRMTRKTVMADIGMLRRSEPSPNGSGPSAANPEVGAGTRAPAEIPTARS
jgi:Putative Actinobacterial Holin-X, holin superfamily III